MDDGRPYTKDSDRDDGGLTEAIAPAHGDDAKDAYRQVGKANLELEGITGRPADGLRDRVRNEKVTEESTNPASRHTDPKQIQQEDFQPALAGPTSPVQTEMTGSDDHRQDREAEDADRNTVHAFPSSRDIEPRSGRLAARPRGIAILGQDQLRREILHVLESPGNPTVATSTSRPATRLITGCTRLRLRLWQLADAEKLRDLWAERDPRSLHVIDSVGRPTVEDLRTSLARQLAETALTGLALLAIEDRHGQFIGYCGLIVGRATWEEPEIAFELFRSHHGRGYY